MKPPRRVAPMGGSLAPVRVAGFRWNGWQPSAVYAIDRVKDPMIPSKKEFFEKLEESGDTEVREKLAQCVYGEVKIPLVKEWLRRKVAEQEEQKHAGQMQRENDALEIARQANKIAIDANILSERASASASRANRISWWSVGIALLAIIIAVASQYIQSA